MSAAAHASRKWVWIGVGLACAGTGYMLYAGPGQKLNLENKQRAILQATSAPDALDPNAFRPFKLSDIKKYNHNTNIFTFAFDYFMISIKECQISQYFNFHG